MESVRKNTTDKKNGVTGTASTWKLVALASAFFHPVSKKVLDDAGKKLNDTIAHADETMRLVQEQGAAINHLVWPATKDSAAPRCEG